MDLPVPDELLEICKEIIKEGMTDEQWSDHAAEDWFQTETVTGGYNFLDKIFTFSYYPPDGGELWVQLALAEVEEVAAGARAVVEATPAYDAWFPPEPLSA